MKIIKNNLFFMVLISVWIFNMDRYLYYIAFGQEYREYIGNQPMPIHWK